MEAHQRATRRVHPGFTQAVCRDLPTTVEKETRDKEKWERTSETPASTVIPSTQDEDGQAGCFYFSGQVSGQHLCAWLTLDLWK